MIARVLIVDDNADAAKMLGILLQRHGCVVEVVTDSTRCLPCLEAFLPDVLLLDMAMPILSGYEIARQIRGRTDLKRLIIFAISGYVDPLHVQRSLEAGCDRHFAKPVDSRELLQSIPLEIEKRLLLDPACDLMSSPEDTSS